MEDDRNARMPEENDMEGEGRARARPPQSITREERIAERAYLISQSDQAGTDEENWLRAERELREEQELQDC